MLARRSRAALSSPPLSGEWIRTVAVALMMGTLLFAVGLALSDILLKRLVPAAAACLVGLIGIATGQAKRFLLFAWVVSLTYNRNYFFEALDAHGSYGPYWIPSDVFLVGLLLLWAYERAIARVPAKAYGPSTAKWLMPLLLAALLSAFTAVRPEWTGFEITRLLRMAVVAWYLRYNLGPQEWWICVAAFGTAVLYQVTQGAFYVATGTVFGLSTIFGTAGGDAMLQQFNAGVTGGHMRRAQGTLGHPNTLALYLLMITPMFIALALTVRERAPRAILSIVAMICVLGIAVTLSRTSWAITVLQFVALLGMLTALRYLSAKRSLGILIAIGFSGLLLLAPFSGLIYQRLTGDLADSLDFRSQHDATAIEIWSTSPYTGIGLNNYSDLLRYYEPEDTALHDRFEEVIRKIWEVRLTSWVHNIYLLFLAETGVIGLIALLIYFGSLIGCGIRAIRLSEGYRRTASIGLTLGAVGFTLHGLQESVFWIDPVTYTTVLVLAMLNNAPAPRSRPHRRSDSTGSG